MNDYGNLRIKKYEFINILVYVFVVIHTLWWIFSLEISNANLSVMISFFAIGIVSFISLVCHKNCIDIYSSVHIFNYVFFFMAAMQQYLSNVVLWSGNGLVVRYTDGDYIKANIAILIMTICFNITYGRKFQCKKVRIKIPDKIEFLSENMNISDGTLLLLLTISIMGFILLAITGNLLGKSGLSNNVAVSAQLFNILRYFPVCTLIVYILNCRHEVKKCKRWFVTIIAIEIIFLFFPTNGNLARFILFGTYIAIATLFVSENKYKSMYFFILYLGFCYAFSASRGMKSFIGIIGTTTDFVHVDFDAYQILMLCMKYVEAHGVVYGKNIISAMLFLIPRAIWKGKMIGTASIVVAEYGSWQTNVSTAFVAETFFGFGWIGIVVIGLLMGSVVLTIDSWYESNDLFKQGAFCIITGMSIYILRGSLLASIAFTGGLLLSLIFILFVCKLRLGDK